METNDNLNAVDSIELIRRMIDNTRRNVIRRSGVPFLIWGYITAAVSVGVYLGLHLTGSYYWNWLWFAIPLLGWPAMTVFLNKRPKPVTTYIDRVIGYIWTTTGIVGGLVSILTIIVPFVTTEPLHIPILFIIILLMGVGTATTGLVAHTPVVTIAGLLSSVVLAPMTLLVRGEGQCLVFAAVFIVMMIIPGHFLNRQSRSRC